MHPEILKFQQRSLEQYNLAVTMFSDALPVECQFLCSKLKNGAKKIA